MHVPHTLLRAASGHAAAAPLLSVMNSRRFIRPKLWRGHTTYPEVLETARDASKATAEVACGCELCFDRLSRAVGSGEGARSVGRATNAVGYEYLRVLCVWGADKHHGR